MRITFVIPNDNLSGGIKVVAIYAAALRERGHEVLVVGNQLPSQPMSRLDRVMLRFGRIVDVPAAGSHFEGSGVAFRLYPPARRLKASDFPDADVVIATWWTTAEVVLSLPPAKGRKVYLVQGHDVHPSQPLDRVRATLRSRMQKVVVSEWLRHLMSSLYGDASAILVPNGVDCSWFRSASSRTRAERPTVGFVYSSHPVKGCDVALRAIAIARQTYPEMVVHAFGRHPIAGDTEAQRLIRYAYRPSQRDIVDTYAACDVWLFPSRAEGFGLPLLEAAACGTPLVATPAGAAPEIIAAGAGLLAEMDNPESMSEGILQILGMSVDAWSKMSSRCIEVAQAHDWASSVVRLESVLSGSIEAEHGQMSRADGENKEALH